MSDSDSDVEFDDYEKFKEKRRLSSKKASVSEIKDAFSSSISLQNKNFENLNRADDCRTVSDSDDDEDSLNFEAKKIVKSENDEELSEIANFITEVRPNFSHTNAPNEKCEIETEHLSYENLLSSDIFASTSALNPDNNSLAQRCGILLKHQTREAMNKMIYWQMDKSFGELISEYSKWSGINPDNLIMMGEGTISYSREQTPNSKAKFYDIKKWFSSDNNIQGVMKFVFDSSILSDDTTPEEEGMEDDDCIDVFICA